MERLTQRDMVAIGAVGLLLQAFCLYAVPLVFECDAAVYFNYSAAETYRAPAFAWLLTLTGQHLLHSFTGTVLVQALFGVAVPLLAYACIVPTSRATARVSAVLILCSLVPFTGAKLMLAEQLFMVLFLVCGMVLSRYLRTGRPSGILWVAAAGLAAMFTRWEGEFLLAACLLATLPAALRSPDRRAPIYWGAGVVVVLAVCVGWSYHRTRVMQDGRVFGTLQNGLGDQLFWAIYSSSGAWDTYYWEQILSPAVAAARRHDPPSAASTSTLLSLDNGPAARELASAIRRVAAARPSEDIFNAHLAYPGGGGFLTRLGGDPERLVAEIFSDSNDTYVFSIPGELRRELGAAGAERLLIGVCVEAIRRRPAFLASRGVRALEMFGVSLTPDVLSAAARANPLGRFPAQGGVRAIAGRGVLLSLWDDIHYADMPFDMGGCATAALPPRMLTEYRWDSRLTRSSDSLVAVLSFARNAVRNTVGPLALLTWWILFASRERALYLSLMAGCLAVVGITGALGGGAYTRYESATLPIIVMLTCVSIAMVVERVRAGLRRPGAA